MSSSVGFLSYCAVKHFDDTDANLEIHCLIVVCPIQKYQINNPETYDCGLLHDLEVDVFEIAS